MSVFDKPNVTGVFDRPWEGVSPSRSAPNGAAPTSDGFGGNRGIHGIAYRRNRVGPRRSGDYRSFGVGTAIWWPSNIDPDRPPTGVPPDIPGPIEKEEGDEPPPVSFVGVALRDLRHSLLHACWHGAFQSRVPGLHGRAGRPSSKLANERSSTRVPRVARAGTRTQVGPATGATPSPGPGAVHGRRWRRRTDVVRWG